jgi:hypothetical protein
LIEVAPDIDPAETALGNARLRNFVPDHFVWYVSGVYCGDAPLTL